MLKKASTLSLCSSLQTCGIHSSSVACTPPKSTTSSRSSSSSSSSRSGTRPCNRRQQHRSQSPLHSLARWSRCYATIRDGGRGKAPDFRDNINWPCHKNKSTTGGAVRHTPIPTPYEIFQLERGAVYSKHRYYELVKLYHPDRHGHYEDKNKISDEHDGITRLERLERYRLVVQAHEILSDPVKRRAYDAYGTGWAQPRTAATRHTRGYTNGATGKAYGYGPDHDSTVFGNATWEDWERWYREREDQYGKQNQRQAYAGIYVNPNAFASFVIILAVLSGVLQATRAGQYTASLGEQAQALTEETQKFMSARAQNFSDKNLVKSDDRIKHFLERRDPSRYGLKDEEEEMYRKHFAGDHILPSSSMSSSSSTSSTRSNPGSNSNSNLNSGPSKRRQTTDVEEQIR